MEILLPYLDRVFAIFLLIAISMSFRIILQLCGQQWITTIAHTSTLVLLPILTYVITGVISGNIALSLGMVGALSIVRFRNPVRSPLELSIYFGAITMGIAASVSIMWLLFLVGAVLLAAASLIFMHYISLFFLKRRFFNTSFAEGNALSSLSITCEESILSLDSHESLKTKRLSQEFVNYVLVSQDFNALKRIISEIEDSKSIKSYELNQ